MVAGFAHRTSREGDPQLHSHCLVPNLAQRVGDGRVVALDGGPLFEWGRAGGSIYQNELQRLLSLRLGVVWGPDRHNTREMVGVTAAQLRVFSKRSAQIEAEWNSGGRGTSRRRSGCRRTVESQRVVYEAGEGLRGPPDATVIASTSRSSSHTDHLRRITMTVPTTIDAGGWLSKYLEGDDVDADLAGRCWRRSRRR